MQYLIIAALAFALPPFVVGKTSGQLCRGTSTYSDDGNWYCSEVRTITYRNISQSGSYNRTMKVDPDTGICDHETISYSGTDRLTPLFGELSMHLRGPMNVSQIAVYTFSGSAMSASADPSKSNHMRKRQMGSNVVPLKVINSTHTIMPDTVTVANAPFESSQSTSDFPPFSTPQCRECLTTFETRISSANTLDTFLATPEQTATSPAQSAPADSSFLESSPTEPSPSVSSVPASTSTDQAVSITAEGTWDRVAYYTSTAPAEATGIVFLANLGDPQKSGTFDYSFGNSLGYVSQDGHKVVSQITPFGGNLVTSEYEIAAFTDQQCGTDCEYARPMSTAYHGWSGDTKAFFIEFQMDHYNNTGSDQGMLSDAPAWWFLNAAIPRVLQYGNDRNNIPCSCWSTGCGEFDAFEVLGMGEEKAKSTIHRQGNLEGGDSNYFARPVGRMLKLAVVFYDYNITTSVLADDFDFGEELSMDQILDVVKYDPSSNTHSLFAIGT